MDFTLNEEQLAIRETCREFAEQEIKPLAEEMDRKGEFPYEIIRQMGELGAHEAPNPPLHRCLFRHTASRLMPTPGHGARR